MDKRKPMLIMGCGSIGPNPQQAEIIRQAKQQHPKIVIVTDRSHFKKMLGSCEQLQDQAEKLNKAMKELKKEAALLPKMKNPFIKKPKKPHNDRFVKRHNRKSKW